MMTLNCLAALLLAASASALALRAAEDKPAPVPQKLDPAKATLTEALEDWIKLVEADDAKTAGERWGRDAKARQEMTGLWARVKAAHRKHDYRKWLGADAPADNAQRPDNPAGGAKGVGEAAKFKVGGHTFSHLHVDWEKTEQGWRIKRVWGCR